MRLTQSTKLLNDGLLDQSGWQEITTWLAHDCFQRFSHEGVVAVAWVLPRDTQALCDTHKLLTLLEERLVGIFNDSEAACNWLHLWPRVSNKGVKVSYL